MTEIAPDNNLQPMPNKYYFTAQARRAHVRAYQADGKSMIEYCEKHSLALSTFKAWVTKYGEKKTVPGFIPVVAKNARQLPGEKPVAFRNIEVQANGLKIIIPEIVDTNSLIQLIQGLTHATHQIERPFCMDL